MIVDPRGLALLPTDRHHFKTVVLVDQISSVEIWAPVEILRDRIDIDGSFAEELINVVAGEYVFGNIVETVD